MKHRLAEGLQPDGKHSDGQQVLDDEDREDEEEELDVTIEGVEEDEEEISEMWDPWDGELSVSLLQTDIQPCDEQRANRPESLHPLSESSQVQQGGRSAEKTYHKQSWNVTKYCT